MADTDPRYERLEEAQRLHESGAFDSAEAAYDALIRDAACAVDDSDAVVTQVARMNLAALLEKKGQVRAARDLYLAAAREGHLPLRVAALSAALPLEMGGQESGGAVALLGQLLDEAADDPESAFPLATAMRIDLVLAQERGDETRARSAHARWLDAVARSAEVARATYVLGRALLRTDLDAQAMTAFGVLVSRGPEDLARAALREYAFHFADNGLLPDALELVQGAERLGLARYLIIADLLLAAEDYEQVLAAVADLSVNVDVGTRAEALLRKASALESLNRIEESEEALRAAAGTNSGEPSYNAWRRIARRHLDRLATADAIDALQEAMKGGVSSRAATGAAWDLGAILAEQDRLEDARELFAFAGDSPDADIAGGSSVALAQVLARQGDDEGARSALLRAMSEGDSRSADMARRLFFDFRSLRLPEGDEVGVAGQALTDVLEKIALLSPEDDRNLAALCLETAHALSDLEAPAFVAALLRRGAEHALYVFPKTVESTSQALGAAIRADEIDLSLFGQRDPRTFDAVRVLVAASGERLGGDAETTVERGIERGEAVLSIPGVDRFDTPLKALLMNNLAGLYLRRVTGERFENVARAIGLYEQALALHQRTGGEDRPLVLSTVGNLLSALASTPGLAETATQERAIALGEEYVASAKWRDQAEARLIMPLLVNLANAYTHRNEGDPLANTSRAVDLAEKAVEGVGAAFGPASLDAAKVRVNLAAAYAGLPETDPRYKRIIAVLDEARAIAEEAADPEGRLVLAETLEALGRAYSILADRETASRRDLVEQAVAYHERALALLKLALPADDTRLAGVATSLGVALLDRGDFQDFTEAIEALEFAVTVAHHRQGTTRDEVYGYLAVAYLGQSTANNDTGDLQKALQYGHEALRPESVEGHPRLWLHLGQAIGWQLGDRGLFREAVPFFRAAAAAGALLLEATALIRSRSGLLEDVGAAAVHLAFVLAHEGDSRGAIQALETARARWLKDALLRDQAELSDVDQVRPELARAFREAVTRLNADRRTEVGTIDRLTRPPLTGTADAADFALQLDANDALAAFRAARDAIRASGFPQFLASVDLTASARNLGEGGAAAYVATASWGTLTGILFDDGRVECDVCSDVRHDLLVALINARAGRHKGGRPSYLLGQLGDEKELASSLERAARLLGRSVLEPLTVRLVENEVERLVLVPCGGLARLPLHVLGYNAAGRTLLDDFAVTVAPSVEVLRSPRRRTRVDEDRTLATLIDPTDSLEWAPLEVAAISAVFDGASVPMDSKARAEDVLLSASRASRVHLACHGQYDTVEFLDSGFTLRDGATLNLRDLLAGPELERVELVVASACQSAMIARHPDEALTLATGFLLKGASAVVGSLWAVDDLSTALLMRRLYFNLERRRLPPEGALREAQLWMRDASATEVRQAIVELAALAVEPRGRPQGDGAETDMRGLLSAATRALRLSKPYRNPYYWAPFICISREAQRVAQEAG